MKKLKLGNLPKVTHLKVVDPEFELRQSMSRAHTLNHYVIFLTVFKYYFINFCLHFISTSNSTSNFFLHPLVLYLTGNRYSINTE